MGRRYVRVLCRKKTFGRHKLIEKVSPKKRPLRARSAEFLGSVFGIHSLRRNSCEKNGVGINYINLVVTGVLAAVISQVGDLIMSCIKRENHIKDYGDIIPGHGGIFRQI
ncbi:MAG: phosphatidate cytidylyltransferase [Clostridiales bacterium]|nr:MAG: phosphatidate cytidylyltransferase [Clostridiales bacterium]